MSRRQQKRDRWERALIAQLTEAAEPEARVKAAEALAGMGRHGRSDALLGAVADPDDAVRIAVIKALGAVGERRASGPIAASLGSDSPQVREAAARALALLKPEEAIPALAAALANTPAAADALVALGARDALLAAGRSRSASAACRRALGALATLKVAEALAVMVDALREPALAEAAVVALGDLRDPRALVPLLGALERGVPGAAAALGRVGDPRAVWALRGALDEGPLRERLDAVAALGRLSGDEPRAPLRVLLIHPEPQLRRAAAAALWRLGEPGWRAIVTGDDGDLRRLAESRLPGARALVGQALSAGIEGSEHQLAALRYLGERGDRDAAPVLFPLLGSPSPAVRVGAAAALEQLRYERWEALVFGDDEDLGRLGDCGDPRAVSALVAALGRGPLEHRRAAAIALGGGSARAAGSAIRQQAIAALQAAAEEPELATAAGTALIHLGDQAAVVDAARLLERAGVPGRERAARALGHSRHARAREPLLSALGDTDPAVRRAAALGLERHGWRQWASWVRGEDGDWARIRDSGHHEAVKPLLRALSEGVPGAVAMLGAAGDDLAVPPLAERLDGADAAGIQEAADALGLIGGEVAVRALVSALGSDAAATRLAAAAALDASPAGERTGDGGSWRALVHGDGNDVRRLARAIPASLPALTRALASPDVASRLAATRALSEAPDRPDVRDRLLRALGDREPGVQAAAAAALFAPGVDGVARLEAAGGADALACLLLETSVAGTDAFTAAVVALRRLGGDAAAQAGRGMLYGRDRTRTNALLDEQEALFFAPMRRRTISRAVEALRSARLDGLGLLVSAGAWGSLLDALVDRDPAVRRAAAIGLQELGQPRWAALVQGNGGDLRRLAESKEPERLRLLVLARKLNAELPAAARALLQEAQAGAFSLEVSAGVGDLSLSHVREGGSLSLKEDE